MCVHMQRRSGPYMYRFEVPAQMEPGRAWQQYGFPSLPFLPLDDQMKEHFATKNEEHFCDQTFATKTLRSNFRPEVFQYNIHIKGVREMLFKCSMSKWTPTTFNELSKSQKDRAKKKWPKMAE
jgi:hypothetical protein